MTSNNIRVIKNLHNDEYQKSPGIRASLVKSYHTRVSDYNFYKKNLCKDKPVISSSLALDIGSAAHCLILEGEEAFNRDFVVSSFRKGTLKYKEIQQANPSKTIITEAVYTNILKMRESLQKNKGISKILSEKGQPELSVFWEYKGQKFKCRFDYVTRSGIVIDLKTCQCANPNTFLGDIKKWSYELQSAYYSWAEEETLGFKNAPFVFLVASKNYPYECSMIGLGQKTLEKARRDLFKIIDELIEKSKQNKWDSYGEDLHILELEEN